MFLRSYEDKCFHGGFTRCVILISVPRGSTLRRRSFQHFYTVTSISDLKENGKVIGLLSSSNAFSDVFVLSANLSKSLVKLIPLMPNLLIEAKLGVHEVT